MQHPALGKTDIALSDEILDQIDDVVAPGTDSGPMGAVYAPPAVTQASLRRRPTAERRASYMAPELRVCSTRRLLPLRAWR